MELFWTHVLMGAESYNNDVHSPARFWRLLLVGLTLPGATAVAQSSSLSATSPAQGQSAPQNRSAPGNASPLPPDVNIRRLILKDGSYQPVKQFEVHGERVRYLSSEREEWEEVPYSVVDWAATEKYARQDHSRQVSAETKAALDAEAAEAASNEGANQDEPIVAPGLRLPEKGGVYLLDVYKHEPELSELQQSGSEVKQNSGRDTLHAVVNPLSNQKQTIELPGQHARIQSHVPNPFLYVDIEDDAPPPQAISATDLQSRYRLIRLDSVPKKNMRVLGSIKTATEGRVREQERFVPATVEIFAGGWLKVTPKDSLAAGEYALAEVSPENELNLDVWDFGVSPGAPENPGAVKGSKKLGD